METVTVLVAAYNNGLYIETLLDSLLSQTHKELDIVVRDDGSSDGTKAIVGRMRSLDGRIRVLGSSGSPGACANFFALLLGTVGNYTMFCDADDVWNADKVEKTLALMRETESKNPAGTPVLVHTDLTVADEVLDVVSPSLFCYERLSPDRKTLRNLLAQNNVTGCTVMINRPLKDMVRYTPQKAVMHDWWLALIASAFGEIAVLDEPTMLYRQHKSNQIGAYDAGNLSASLGKFKKKEHMRGIYSSMYAQAEGFYETFQDILSERQRRCVKGYAEMSSLSKLGKISRIIAGGYYKNTLVRNIGQFLIV